jgi:hypothetical protein
MNPTNTPTGSTYQHISYSLHPSRYTAPQTSPTVRISTPALPRTSPQAARVLREMPITAIPTAASPPATTPVAG